MYFSLVLSILSGIKIINKIYSNAFKSIAINSSTNINIYKNINLFHSCIRYIIFPSFLHIVIQCIITPFRANIKALIIFYKDSLLLLVASYTIELIDYYIDIDF